MSLVLLDICVDAGDSAADSGVGSISIWVMFEVSLLESSGLGLNSRSPSFKNSVRRHCSSGSLRASRLAIFFF